MSDLVPRAKPKPVGENVIPSRHQFLHARLLMEPSVIVPLCGENLNFKMVPAFSGCRDRSTENLDVFTVVVKCV